MKKSFNLVIGGKEIIVETGLMARQAGGSVTVTCGGTVVLVTAVMSKKTKEGDDGLPLIVEYKERTYAAGRIPGGYFKREGRPTEREILIARLIDRPIRPLFPEGMTNEVQVMAMVISSDGENDPDVLSVIGASCALGISEIPFLGPLGAVKIGRVDGQFIINPTYAQIEKADLDIVVCATTEGVIMIESGASEIVEADILKAVELGIKECSAVIDFQKKMIAACGKNKQDIELKKISEEIVLKVKELSEKDLADINSIASKDERVDAIDGLLKELVDKLAVKESGISEADVAIALYKIEKESIRGDILNKKKRVDGRGFNEIREINCNVGILPRTHGSALFTRGQTQSLVVTTLGTGSDEQMIESLEGGFQKSFMLHYNFPPFSVGEVKPLRGPGRREIGHGALAERALKPTMPDKEKFPYTVRLVSDILESNGSSSMATVCAGSLAMMDAGIPMKKSVAGIAMGLVKEGNSFEVLTDIAGVEDHYGDMDFKVAGTTEGITAMQVDIKLKTGITMDVITKAITEAKRARLTIIDKMKSAIENPRNSISEYAPHIVTLKINPEKIKDVIGPGGKIIKKIIADTGVSIDIEDNGIVNIASSDNDALRKAISIVEKITEEPEVGRIYHGVIKRVMAFGAFCEILPNREGLIHVSELSNEFVKNVEDVIKIGDNVDVKLIKIDEQGRLNLSIKQAQIDN